MAARDSTGVARAYFAALGARDLDAMLACWAPGGREVIRGMVDAEAPDGVRAFFASLFAAVPDFALTVQDVVAEADRAVVRWTATGTFAGASDFKGLRPNGRRVELEGADILTVRDGLIVRNDAFTDSMKFARDIGLLPAEGSRRERGLFGAFNAGGRALGSLAGGAPEEVADGVWIVRGGVPRTMNVYLVRDVHDPAGVGRDGVLCFDAGVHAMVPAIRAAATRLGGLTRVVLGHAHADHRGAASGLGVPVWCHEADRADAEGDAGEHYFRFDRLAPVLRPVYPRLLASWDGGPVAVERTLSEGDDVAGFRVVHLPGHAPGMIALWRASDRLALTSDCFYTLDPQTGRRPRPTRPRVPHPAFNHDTDAARASMRKLAALSPSAAWPGHAKPLRGDVRGQLEAAAAATGR